MKIQLYKPLLKYIKQTSFKKLAYKYKESLLIRANEFYDITGDEPYLQNLKVWYGDIPTAIFLKYLETYPFWKEDFDSIEAWHKHYIKNGVEDHKEQLAVILFDWEEEPIADGWHRLNSYIKQGRPYIPIVQDENFFSTVEKYVSLSKSKCLMAHERILKQMKVPVEQVLAEVIKLFKSNGISVKRRKFIFNGRQLKHLVLPKTDNYYTIAINTSNKAGKFNVSGCPVGFMGSRNETWPIKGLQDLPMNEVGIQRVIKKLYS